MRKIRLGVNIDHVATVRNARGGNHPCPVKAAILAQNSGADGITAHLREDRRHIRDNDMYRIKQEISIPLNMEMAATEEMLNIAIKVKPNAVCLVPEKREEVTTEGGLDIAGKSSYLKDYIAKVKGHGIRVSLFIEADEKQITASCDVGADIVEFHTGSYAHKFESGKFTTELQKIEAGVKMAHDLGIECHAGHGLSFANVTPIVKIPYIVELNIGHFLIGEAISIGLPEAIKKMKSLMIPCHP